MSGKTRAQRQQSARALGREFERAMLAAYRDQAKPGELRAFDVLGAGEPYVVLWTIAPRRKLGRLLVGGFAVALWRWLWGRLGRSPE